MNGFKSIFIPQLPHFAFLYSFWSLQQRQENTEMTLNRSAEILVNFILAPALMIFTVLLYAYVGKIILAGGVAKGMVSNIALPYLVGGLGVYALRSISVKANWDGFFKFSHTFPLYQLYCYGWPLTVELVPMLGLNNEFI